MAGVKGRSGRKSNYDEEQKLRVLRKAWNLIEANLSNVNIPLENRIEIASKLVVKNIPQDLNSNINAKVTNMPAIQKTGEADNRISEFIIGSHPNDPELQKE